MFHREQMMPMLMMRTFRMRMMVMKHISIAVFACHMRHHTFAVLACSMQRSVFLVITNCVTNTAHRRRGMRVISFFHFPTS
jgi:hypothetical protein